jgi:hypothetical protein
VLIVFRFLRSDPLTLTLAPRSCGAREAEGGGRVFDLGGFLYVGDVTARVDARPPPFLGFGDHGPPLLG